MKNKSLIIIVLSVMILTGSCKKFLDEKPLSEASLDQFYKTKFDVDAAIAGMYSAFQQQMVGEKQYMDRYHFWGEFRSDNFDRFERYTNNNIDEIVFNSLTPANPYTDWSGLYNVISRANSNIKYIPKSAQYDSRITPELISSYLSQSYALRAECYFYIVRVWGDAPIWLEPFEDLSADAEKQRETRDKIINEVIIPDLEKAYSLITKGERTEIWYIGEGAICAMLADVYMWNKDYTNAIEWIQNLFKAKGPTGKTYTGSSEANLQPTESWKSLFTDPSKSIGSIWSLNWDYTKNGCACMEISWTPNNKQVVVDEGIWESWFLPQTTTSHTSDIRPKQTLDVWVNFPNTNNRDRFIKFYPTSANPTAADPWPATNESVPVYLPMYRLGGLYLLYAEALNGNNDLAGALQYLNYVHTRAGLPAYAATDPAVATKEAMEDAILQERQWELMGEGKRWFDLVRTDHVKKVMDPILKRRQINAGNLNAPGFIDPQNKVLWPISRSVLNSNNKLNQNPGYTD